MRRLASTADPYGLIRDGTDAHRARHGCGAHPFSDGTLLSVIAAAVEARRILELGTALGYTALCLAHGGEQATVDTIEFDAEHVRLARENVAAAGMAQRITVHHGDFAAVLPRLAPPYDLAFFDGFGPTLAYLERIHALLRPRGILIASNLTIGGAAREVRAELQNPARWLTSFAVEGGRTALSVRL